MNDIIRSKLHERITLLDALCASNRMGGFDRLIRMTVNCLKNGGKLLICGNGGSAADAQHIAAEFVGRFITNRDPIPAVALNSDTSVLTSVANDFGYEYVFSRQVQAIGLTSDLLIVLSTSGNSENVCLAAKMAKQKRIKTFAFIGNGGGKLRRIADEFILIPECNAALIQEANMVLCHILCEIVEQELSV